VSSDCQTDCRFPLEVHNPAKAGDAGPVLVDIHTDVVAPVNNPVRGVDDRLGGSRLAVELPGVDLEPRREHVDALGLVVELHLHDP